MGCSASTKFNPNNTIDGQGDSALEIFLSLGFNRNDIDACYMAFKDIDKCESDTILALDIFSHFSIEFGLFEKHIFSIFDPDGTGLIRFSEFVCALWNFLTMSEIDLGILIYLMNDPSGTFVVKYEIMETALEVVHKTKTGTSTSLQSMADGLKERFPFEISLKDFLSWCKTAPAILTPAIVLQLKLRRCILGERFWVHHASLRSQNVAESNRVTYIIQLREKIKASRRKSIQSRLKAQKY